MTRYENKVLAKRTWEDEEADLLAEREAEQAEWEEYLDRQDDIRQGLADAGLLDP